jgi:predicted nucleic acid-binding protein
MPIYLVDTSAWIFALRRNPVAAIAQELGKLLKQDELATCPLVGLELLGGAANESEYARLQARLRGLHRLDIDNQDWEAAARLAFDLRRRGVTVPFTDALLAAVAIRAGAILLHADRDFDGIARFSKLRVQSLIHLLVTDATSQ